MVFAQSDPLVHVGGTHCSLVPPKGFVPSETFSGFMNEATGASIMITEIPAPYEMLVNSFTAPALKTKGMTLLGKENMEISGMQATIFQVSQMVGDQNYLKQMMFFGDSSNTVMVNGIYPDTLKYKETDIKKALLTTVYATDQKEDNPIDLVNFTLDTEGTEFKKPKYFAGALMYSIDGKIPTEKPIFTATNAIDLRALVESEGNKKNFALKRIKNLPQGENNVVTSNKPIKSDDLEGYETIANGLSKDNKPTRVYQVILFPEDDPYFILVGETKEDFDKYEEIFRKLALSFKRKAEK